MTNVVCPKCKADNCPNNNECINCDHTLIGDEVRLLDETRNLWSKILMLPESHPDERNDFKDAIHKIQDLIAFRIASKLTDGIFREWKQDVIVTVKDIPVRPREKTTTIHYRGLDGE